MLDDPIPHMDINMHVFNMDHVSDILWSLSYTTSALDRARISGRWRVNNSQYYMSWEDVEANEANARLADLRTWMTYGPKADKVGVIPLYPDRFVEQNILMEGFSTLAAPIGEQGR